MITIEAHYAYLLIASNAVILGLACFFLARFEKRARQIETFWASPTGSALTNDSDDDANESMRITQRLEQRVGELQRTVKVMAINNVKPPAQPVERNLPIENAVRMARLGASIDDLTKSCGLNIGEARLMQKLHGQAKRQAAGNG